MTSIETAGARFKDAERALRQTLPSKSIIGMRLDGKAFHTFTRQFASPYDLDFMKTMDTVALEVTRSLPGAMLAYVQSDEISIIFSDLFPTHRATSFNDPDLPFGGKVEKILSTSAAMATGTFLSVMPEVLGLPIFDARLFLLDDLDEVQSYVDWRRLDARKNSISMAASALYSPRELHGKSTRERHAMLEGTPYETLPGGFFEGRLILRANEFAPSGEVSRVWETHQATRDLTRQTIDLFRTR